MDGNQADKKTRYDMWMNYNTNDTVAKKIKGVSAKDSIAQAKRDGGAGVVEHPVTGERIYWSR
jgi:hypothetical protein